MNTYLISNVNIILLDRVQQGVVLVSAGKIAGIYSSEKEISLDLDEVSRVDGKGRYLSPGFIDIHIHGGGGADFMDGTVEAFLTIAETHATFGTTAMLPTTLTTTQEQLEKTLGCYEEACRRNSKGAQFLGMHLEGPYFAMEQRGAQDPRYIRDPDPQEYQAIIQRFPFIKRWSVAPELPGAVEMGEYLVKHNIIAAVAHSDALYEDVEKAHQVGYTLMTHFYSAMSSIKRVAGHRFAGVVEAGYLIDGFDLEIIADGVHLPKHLLQLISRFKSHDRIVLITDAMRAAGTQVDESILGPLVGGTKVIIEDGVAKLQDRTAFAGSIATCDLLVRVMRLLVELPLHTIVRMVTFNAARVLGISNQKGSIQMGMDADLILFDENIEVSWTMVQGNVIYNQL
ncbi:N-acetylglucosamine-6-phosphate deacetylase [Sphingobacterium sp. SYP-B4668]|uniref:N-acetylglucosamine-6-phosphate deacetylase n=1 Tax=Sphingobacterium sp. SYP-B4668 TaxID=2996035 RepID=UPI0022DDEFA2|nr:N-acetylglucosamine-6-phosphate deacetylase [Sphingobacterium sp. SYP-B4668]